MSTIATNLQKILTELAHGGTTHRKRLITVDQHKGEIATMNYAWLTQGKKLDAHAHPDGEEYYLFISGSGEMLVGEKWFPVGKDDFVTVPVNHMHSLVNHEADPLVFIAVRTVISTHPTT